MFFAFPDESVFHFWRDKNVGDIVFVDEVLCGLWFCCHEERVGVLVLFIRVRGVLPQWVEEGAVSGCLYPEAVLFRCEYCSGRYVERVKECWCRLCIREGDSVGDSAEEDAAEEDEEGDVSEVGDAPFAFGKGAESDAGEGGDDNVGIRKEVGDKVAGDDKSSKENEGTVIGCFVVPDEYRADECEERSEDAVAVDAAEVADVLADGWCDGDDRGVLAEEKGRACDNECCDDG